jgi:hypothetical protein
MLNVASCLLLARITCDLHALEVGPAVVAARSAYSAFPTVMSGQVLVKRVCSLDSLICLLNLHEASCRASLRRLVQLIVLVQRRLCLVEAL